MNKKWTTFMFLELFVGCLVRLSQLTLVYSIGKILDAIQDKNPDLIFPFLGLIAIALLQLTLSYLVKQTRNQKEREFFLSYRSLYFNQIVNRHYNAFSTFVFDRELSSINKDIALVFENRVEKVQSVAISSFEVIVTLAILLNIHPLLAVFLVILSLLSTLIPYFSKQTYGTAKKQHQDARKHFIARSLEVFESREFMDTATTRTFISILDSLNQTVSRKLFVYGEMRAKLIGMMYIPSYISKFIILCLAMFLLVNGEITVGTLLIVYEYLGSCSSSMMVILRAYNDVNSTSAVYRELREIIKRTSEVVHDPSIDRFESIVISHISNPFHPDSELLQDPMVLYAGRKYALLGENGSGKTTVLNVLNQSIQTPCRYTIDGIDVAGRDLSRLIYHCHQNDHIFQSNLQDNLTIFGAYHAHPLAEVIHLLDLEDCLQYTNCQHLSAGEKQRISLGRAWMSGATIWLLDEVFSNTSKQRKHALIKFLMNQHDITILLVDHDLDEVYCEMFDQIFYI